MSSPASPHRRWNYGPTGMLGSPFGSRLGALGLTPGDREGDSVTLSPDGLEPLAGIIDYKQPNFLGVRTDDGLYCFSVGAPSGHQSA